jgi:hypothetical protein
MLGWIDTGYPRGVRRRAVRQRVLGDRIGSRKLIGLGMLGVAAACAAFGFASTAALFS